jgi:hypothetical protein
MKTVIEMAREAGFSLYRDISAADGSFAHLEAFAELVRADEREKYKWDIHSCGPTCKRYACVAIREAVEYGPQRPWQGLTDEEIDRALDAAKVPELPGGYESVELEIARAIEAKLKEKNNG